MPIKLLPEWATDLPLVDQIQTDAENGDPEANFLLAGLYRFKSLQANPRFANRSGDVLESIREVGESLGVMLERKPETEAHEVMLAWARRVNAQANMGGKILFSVNVPTLGQTFASGEMGTRNNANDYSIRGTVKRVLGWNVRNHKGITFSKATVAIEPQ